MSSSAVGGLIFIIIFIGVLVISRNQNIRAKKDLDEKISQAMIKGDMEYAEMLIKARSNYK